MTDDRDRPTGGILGFVSRYSETFVSLAALITAVAAVVITMEQTKVMREEAALERNNARISVMPSVWLSTFIGDEDGEGYFKIVIVNRGLGPAVIERFDVSYKSEPVPNWDALGRRIAADKGAADTWEGKYLSSIRSPVSPGLMLAAGGQAEPFAVFQSDNVEGLKLMLAGAANLSVSLCYCSLYGDCYRSHLFARPEEAAACEAPERPFISHGFFRSNP